MNTEGIGGLDLAHDLEDGAVLEIQNIEGQGETVLLDRPITSKITTVATEAEDGGEENEKVPQRGQWSNQNEFLMSCISMSVGLGNVWRFPVKAYHNGGGAFLIPYMLVLIFMGCPIYFLELCLGQFNSRSQIKVWRCCPLFQGVGFSAMIATICVMSYYVSIISIIIFYFIASFFHPLPWTAESRSTFSNSTSSSQKSRAEIYFEKEVLKELPNIENGIGSPEWRLTLCLLAAWLVVLCCTIKGVQSSGKVAYITAIFPYIILLTLLIRGLTLKGAWLGVREILYPKWSELSKARVWYEAACQCFFSLNVGFGSIVMFSSYNPFTHNIYRDVIIICFMDTFTSLTAGITVFSVLGYLSVSTGKSISTIVASGGTEIAFVAYPTALSTLPVPQLFAVLFFAMLFTLGIGSTTADAGAIISLCRDKYPDVKQWKFVTVLCISTFLIGLIYVTPGGQFVLNMVDFYGAAFVIVFTAILEVVGVIWVYGMRNFVTDVEFMLGRRMGWYWKICWGFVIPVMLTGLLIYSLAVAETLTYNNTTYPLSATICGWMLSAVCLVPLPICALLALYQAKGSSFKEKLMEAKKPTPCWGPIDPKLREEWKAFKDSRNLDK